MPGRSKWKGHDLSYDFVNEVLSTNNPDNRLGNNNNNNNLQGYNIVQGIIFIFKT